MPVTASVKVGATPPQSGSGGSNAFVRAETLELSRFFDTIGEFSYPLSLSADIISKLKLVAATGADHKDVTSPSAQALVDLLKNGEADWASILRPLTLTLLLTGEAYLIDWGTNWIETVKATTRFVVAPPQSLRSEDDGRGKRVLYQPDPLVKDGWWTIPADATLSRIWLPHPLYPEIGRPPTLPVLPILREIELTEKAVRVALLNRGIMNGLLYVPSEIGEGPPLEEGGAPTNPVATAIQESVLANIRNPNSSEAAAPIIISGPAEYGAQLQQILLTRPLEAELLVRTTAAITRLAQGLPIPPEIVTGLAETNHWNAWQIDIMLLQDHLLPLVHVIVNALSRIIFADAATHVWYDDTQLRQPNPSADTVSKLVSEGLISEERGRADLGYTEDDKPTGLPLSHIKLAESERSVETVAQKQIPIAASLNGFKADSHRIHARPGLPPVTKAIIIADSIWLERAAGFLLDLAGGGRTPDSFATAINDQLKATLSAALTPAGLAPAERVKTVGNILLRHHKSIREVVAALTSEAESNPKMTDRDARNLIHRATPMFLGEPATNKPLAAGLFSYLKEKYQEWRGIASSDEVKDTYKELGYETEGLVWQTDSPAHPFPEHADLNNYEFQSDNYPENTAEFPDGDVYEPGDHDGCTCQTAPIIVMKEGSNA